jgi:transposase
MSAHTPRTVSPTGPAPPYAAFLGLDWADQEHAICLLDGELPAGEVVPHTPEAITAWVHRLQQRFGDRPLAVALEQQRGPLIAVLLQFDNLVLFPINPRQLARYRQALFPSGGKTDPDDAELLARFVREHHPRLRAWRPDAPQTRRLGRLCELRRQAVESRKKLGQQLTETLKQYFPLLLQIAGPLTNRTALTLLRRWPTLAQLQRANPQTLRRFWREHGLRDPQQLEETLHTIRHATPLTRDAAIIEPSALWAKSLAAQIGILGESIERFEDEIREAFQGHADAELFAGLPGAGEALAPRLLAAFGTDRERYASAEDLQSYSGIAPVTRRSGKSVHVQRRRACPRFMRQTFHEFANQARCYSGWSRAYYDYLRSRGKQHQAAVRALAYKWIRILYQVWKTRTPYSEQHYISQLRTHHSPCLKFLQPT